MVKIRAQGRPIGSPIRQNIVELLYFLGESTGYDIYAQYVRFFTFCSQRSIYYHLHKGVTTGEFVIKKISSEAGSFSWGPVSEKIYYVLGPTAKPRILIDVEKKILKK